MGGSTQKKARAALDGEGLQRLAIAYVGRYATTQARLRTYLERKLSERGWEGDQAPDLGALVDRVAALGYIDDRAFALARAASLQRRGYGDRRIVPSLRAAGIGDDDLNAARDSTAVGAWQAALDFARRRRIGPFAAERPDRDGRQKALAALLRAGHGFDHARQIIDSMPGCVPEQDD
jgi:regulatory protein